MLIDSHCHLNNEVYEDIEHILKNAEDHNVRKFLCVGFNPITNENALRLSQAYPEKIYCSVGIHPCDVDDIDDQYLLELEQIIINKSNHLIAIGETGLDYFHNKLNKERQKYFFIKQIELAIKYNLPLIIHSRDSVQDIYDILKIYRGKVRGVMHCYSSSLEMALKFIDLNFYISFSGVVTFLNNRTSADIIRNIDLNYLLIETDCPYLAPMPHRGKINQPAFLKFTFEKIAENLNMDRQMLENILENNFKELFLKESSL